MEALSVVHKGDEISATLAQIVQSKPHLLSYLPANTVRLEKGLYQFGHKKIRVQLENREVFVRVGGGFVKFEDYVKRNGFDIDKEELKREKEQSLSSEIHSVVVYPSEIRREQKEPKRKISASFPK